MPRIIEILLALTAIIVLSPILILIILVLAITGEKKVFYFQERIGYSNQKFFIIKFATMLSNSPNMGTGSLTLQNDPRVLPVGKFLRKSKLNELPQLFNILKGDLSIVGPRPQMEVDFMKFPEKIKKEIYKVKPGLTGIGSIIFRDEESILSNISNEDPHDFYKRAIAPYKGELELWYQKNKSIIIDLKLIVLTAYVILFPNSDLYNRWFDNLPKKSF